MSIRKELYGICGALCSPFDDSGEHVDDVRLGTLIDRQIEAGVHGLVLCSGTGEFAYLRPEERRHMIEMGLRHIDGRVAGIAHTSATNLRDGIDLAKHAADHGADALMILPPYFEGPDEAGVYAFYEGIAKAVDCPIVVYNIPVHSGFDVTPALFKRLLEIDGIDYIKDSTGDLVRIQQLIATGGKVLNGGDPIACFSMMAGTVGCIWGAVNVMPRQTVDLYTLIREGDHAAALALWQKIAPANIHFWQSQYIPTIKAATNMMGYDVGPCRQPIQPLTSAQIAELENVLAPLSES
ncbi:MAG: dihydrodipicolinate synthase family protein [Pseudomonadota bacterium]